MAKLAKSRQFRVFPAEGGFSVITRASLEVGAQHEQLGIWRREYDSSTGQHIGYRVIGVELQRVDADLRSQRTPASISAAENLINAGGRRGSRTIGLTEPDRLARIKNGDEPEDRAERVIAKVRVYVRVGAAKGDILRAWPK